MAILSSRFPRKILYKKLNLPELQGEIKEIAKIKCQEACRLVGGPVIVDDTSLCFNALKGLPGMYLFSRETIESTV